MIFFFYPSPVFAEWDHGLDPKKKKKKRKKNLSVSHSSNQSEPSKKDTGPIFIIILFLDIR